MESGRLNRLMQLESGTDSFENDGFSFGGFQLLDAVEDSFPKLDFFGGFAGQIAPG
jgi:hypothetical protein